MTCTSEDAILSTQRKEEKRSYACAMQGGGELPWEVTCRGVVDGIAMVIHMTRREGRRFVEESVYVKGYEAKENQWEIERLE